MDYTSHTSLVAALSNVHTLCSVIGGSASALQHAQLALLAAAQEAGVQRFAPSEYAGLGYDNIDLYQPKALVWTACLEAREAAGLECTRINCGLFMSLLATGTPKPPTEVGKREGAETGEEEALAGLRPWNFVLNMKAGTADLPGDGTAPVAWTDMRDVAVFVYEALSLPSWPENLNLRGSLQSFRQILAIVEKVQDRRFLVRENPLEDLRAMAKDPEKTFYNQVRAALAEGYGDVSDNLNQRYPDIKPVSCEEFVEKWWGGVELGESKWEEDQSFM